jgi:hypothetical protein
LDRGLEIGDDDLTEEAAAVGLAADRIMAVGELIGKIVVQAPDVGVIVIREDEPAFLGGRPR